MKFVKKYIEDILIFVGLFIIIATTFFISKIAGLYFTGVVLFALGIYFSKYPLDRR